MHKVIASILNPRTYEGFSLILTGSNIDLLRSALFHHIETKGLKDGKYKIDVIVYSNSDIKVKHDSGIMNLIIQDGKARIVP